MANENNGTPAMPPQTSAEDGTPRNPSPVLDKYIAERAARGAARPNALTLKQPRTTEEKS